MLQIFAAVGLTGYLSLRNGQKAVNNLVSQLQNEVSNRVDQHLETYLASPQKINSATVDAFKTGLLDPNDLPRIGRFFWKQMHLHDVSYINYGLPTNLYAGAGVNTKIQERTIAISETSPATKGINHNYLTNNQGNRTKLSHILEEYDRSTEAWYQQAMQKLQPAWSDIYV